MIGVGVGALAVVALFVGGIRWFRAKHDDTAEAVATSETVSAVLAVSSVDASALVANVSAGNEATLSDVSGGTSSGTVRRGEEEGQFRVTLNAKLPDVDQAVSAYEVWLVRQVPYDYFSIGEIIKNDAGEWTLEWTGVPKKYDAYTQVVITLEARDGNADPSGHVLEGEFE